MATVAMLAMLAMLAMMAFGKTCDGKSDSASERHHSCPFWDRSG